METATESPPIPSETEFDELYNLVFCNKKLRRFALTGDVIDDNFANSVQRAIEELVPGRNLETFFPPIVVSYSTGHRENVDASNAGPGYIVVACLVRFVFANKMQCYSDIMTPAGYRWTGNFMDRVDEAKVMIVVLSPRLLWSVNCLEEIYRAKQKGLVIIPVRLQQCSMKAEDMWRSEDLERYAKSRYPSNWSDEKDVLEGKRLQAPQAIRAGTIPKRGTFLTDPEALGDLLRRLQLATDTSPRLRLSSMGVFSSVAKMMHQVIDASRSVLVSYPASNEIDCDSCDQHKQEVTKMSLFSVCRLTVILLACSLVLQNYAFVSSADDVLLRRGKKCFWSGGNMRLENLVEGRSLVYEAAPFRLKHEEEGLSKTAIIDQTVAVLKAEGRRFLRRDKHGSWYEVSPNKARQKVKDEFRHNRLQRKKRKRKRTGGECHGDGAVTNSIAKVLKSMLERRKNICREPLLCVD